MLYEGISSSKNSVRERFEALISHIGADEAVKF
jgi:hypothetical protein